VPVCQRAELRAEQQGRQEQRPGGGRERETAAVQLDDQPALARGLRRAAGSGKDLAEEPAPVLAGAERSERPAALFCWAA
jgi:hypothetical protein